MFMAFAQVYRRLQKCMLTLEPSAVIRLLDRLGEGYEQPVFDWQDILAGRILQVCNY